MSISPILSVVTGSIDINRHDFAAHPGATAAILHDRTAVHAHAVNPKGALVRRL